MSAIAQKNRERQTVDSWKRNQPEEEEKKPLIILTDAFVSFAVEGMMTAGQLGK